MKIWQVTVVTISAFFTSLPAWAVKTPTEIVEIAKLVSVQVNPPDGYASSGGSGVIIAKEGNVYTVLTNDHVACLKAFVRESCVTAGTIRTHLGKSYPVISGSVVSLRKQPSDPDLAIVKFSSSDQYAVATLGDSNQLQEATDIFIYGFPSLNNQTKDKRDGSFSKGYIVALVSNSDAGYKLKYEMKTWWGQSGSPLFDPDGRVIGIHGRTDTARNPLSGQETQTGFNLGIPINTFKTGLAKTETKVATVTNNSLSTFQTVNLNNATDADTFYKRGTIALDKGQYQSALNDLNQSISLNPQNAEAYYFRGNAKNKLGDKNGAIADYNEAIGLKPDLAKAYYNRGVVKYDLGDKNGAIADYNEAIGLKPNHASAYHNRGLVKSDLGDKNGAIADYNEAIRIEPDDASSSYNNRGNAKKELGDKQGAIADYNEAIRLKPDLAGAYYNRGIVKNELGDKQGGIADFNEAIRLKPDYAEAYYNRGIVKNELGDKNGAIADYNESIRLKPDASAYINRGGSKV